MLRYSCLVNGKRCVITLRTNNPNEVVPIEIEGDDGTLTRWLFVQGGAFGHLLEDAATPIDLHYCLESYGEQWQPVLLEGAELVKRYDPDVPDSAVT